MQSDRLTPYQEQALDRWIVENGQETDERELGGDDDETE